MMHLVIKVWILLLIRHNYLHGVYRTLAGIWDISSTFGYAIFCAIIFIIRKTQNDTAKNAQFFLFHSDAANVNCGHILKLFLHGGNVNYIYKKKQTGKGNSLATLMVQSFSHQCTNIKIKAMLYLVTLPSCCSASHHFFVFAASVFPHTPSGCPQIFKSS